MSQKKYHVALSYAGEQRAYVAEVAQYLKEMHIRCFYDKDEEISLWGKDILEVLSEVFQSGQAHFVVMFISREYATKSFPVIEKQYSLAQLIGQKQEYILPVRFDDTEIPGLPKTLHYFNTKDYTPHELACIIVEKLVKIGVYFKSNSCSDSAEISHKKSIQRNGDIVLRLNDKNGTPVSGADVYLIHSNKTHIGAESDEVGEIRFSPAQKGIYYTVFVAHERFPAVIESNVEINDNIEVRMERKHEIGSMIFPNGTGSIKGITGWLNPILDAHTRTYLYATNISVNNGLYQPARFKFGENISIEDAYGNTADIKIHRIIQRCTILDFIVHE